MLLDVICSNHIMLQLRERNSIMTDCADKLNKIKYINITI
jgi:hypothetical protein